MHYIFTLRVRLMLVCIPFAIIAADAAWSLMQFSQWPGPPPEDLTGLMIVAALAGFTLLLAGLGGAVTLTVLALQQIILNLVYYRDRAFRTEVLRCLAKVPEDRYQMYDGLRCSGALLQMDMPMSLFLHRMELMRMRGLVETKRFSPSVWKSYRNVPGFRLVQG